MPPDKVQRTSYWRVELFSTLDGDGNEFLNRWKSKWGRISHCEIEEIQVVQVGSNSYALKGGSTPISARK